jgi:membrane-bound inhibitor of C-type lysozyme
MRGTWPTIQNGSLLVLVAALAVGGCAPTKAAAATQVTRYRCAQNQVFTVNRNSEAAIVTYADEDYTLSRKPSSIGLRYASDRATLIIDDDYAAFVTEATNNLHACKRPVG